MADPVSDVEAADVRLIGRRFWVYRGTLDPATFNARFDELGARHTPGDGGPIGMCVVADRDAVQAAPAAVWPGTELLHAGWRPDGRSLRVRYFAGALVTTPLPGRLDPLPPRDQWPSVFPLADAYEVHRFGESDAATVEDVLALWAREEAISDARARSRVDEVKLVATHDGELVAVMTAYLKRNEQLGVDVWYERAFVAEAHRRSNLAMHLAVHGVELLEERWTSGADTRGIGVVIEVEHPGLRGGFPVAVWPYTVTHFIGENERGATVYVRWFPGAEIPI